MVQQRPKHQGDEQSKVVPFTAFTAVSSGTISQENTVSRLGCRLGRRFSSHHHCSGQRLTATRLRSSLRASTFCPMSNLSTTSPTPSAQQAQHETDGEVLQSPIQATDWAKYKKSSDVGFCRRQRSYQSAESEAYIVLKPSIQVSTWRDMPAVTATLVSRDGHRNKLSLAVIAFEKGLFRVAISDLEEPLHERYFLKEVVMDQRKALPIDSSMLDVEDDFASIFMPDRANGVSIHLNPFRLDLVTKESGEIAATINGESRLMVEDFGNTPLFPYGATREEKFKDFTDPQKRGPESIGIDVLFPAAEHLSGIPERTSPFSLPDTRTPVGEVLSEPYRLFNLDIIYSEMDNPHGLYGCVPFLYARTGSSVTGMFWNNASETYVDVQTSSAIPRAKKTHWFSESGIVDIFLLPGPSANDVFQQYLLLTGAPPLPSLFALGYHQCRYSYLDEADVREVDAGFKSRGIPYDVMWLDIDHTNGKRYFTFDSKKYPDPLKLQEDLAKHGRKTVAIIDPHIKRDDSYLMHQLATKEGHYVQRPDGTDFEGECWAGNSSYINFLSPRARDEWGSWLNKAVYIGMTDHLHVWNDMDEPTVFDGPEGTMPKDVLHDGIEHRHVHNLYGHSMVRATYEGLLKNRPNGRPFVLTRSFFAGTQRFSAVWTGDNDTSWSHLRASVRMVTSLQICGMALSGVDIGGFLGNPSGELAVRWYQAGAFQPFFRGHSNKGTKRREPWLFGEEIAACIKHAICARYEFLTYWYTLFASLIEDMEIENRGPPMRPVWWEFDGWSDDGTMWMAGDSLLVVPVMTEGSTRHIFDVPAGRWYDLYDGEHEIRNKVDMEVGLDRMVVFLRGGKVVPRMVPDVRSSMDIPDGKYSLIVGLNERSVAEGIGYFDDGQSQGFRSGDFCVMNWSFADDVLKAERMGGDFIGGGIVEIVTVCGFGSQPAKKVFVEDETSMSEVNFKHSSDMGTLQVQNIDKRIADSNWMLRIER